MKPKGGAQLPSGDGSSGGTESKDSTLYTENTEDPLFQVQGKCTFERRQKLLGLAKGSLNSDGGPWSVSASNEVIPPQLEVHASEETMAGGHLLGLRALRAVARAGLGRRALLLL